MLTINDLVNDMESGCKPRADWRIGIEYERFAFDERTNLPLTYDGVPGIRHYLQSIAAEDGWTIKYENDNPVALERDGYSITLEPGGQVEFSGAPHATVTGAVGEMNRVLSVMARAGDEMNIGFLATGMHPVWDRAAVQWMPKERYRIMRPYMERVGTMGQDMMARTCGAQVNLDFDSEADMVRKYRVTLALQPVVNAIMANSRHVAGIDTGYASYRAHIWTDTDKARSGFLPFVFDEDMGFARYVEYALDVPMYFIRRDGHYLDVAGQSFRAFMEGRLPGYENIYPTLADWHDHLTTLFPDVRLKHYLELRGPDSHNPDMVAAMTAFWTGLLYDPAILAEMVALLAENPALLIPTLRAAVPQQGLATPLPAGSRWPDFCALAAHLTARAEAGLLGQPDSREAATYLQAFRHTIANNCPAGAAAVI